MSNFGLNQFCVMVLIILSPYRIVESAKVLDNDISMIIHQTHVGSKVSQRMQNIQKVPIVIKKRKRRRFLPQHFNFNSINRTDNPNYEQKLMVDAFIKSSNGLFKSEMDVLDSKAACLEDSVVPSPSPLGLYKPNMEHNAKLKIDSSQDKIVHTGRMKRYLFSNRVGTIRPLDHVRDRHGARRCDHDRDNRRCLPKERILRSRQSNLMGGLYSSGFHVLPKFKRRLRSNNGRQVTYNRRYLNSILKRSQIKSMGNDSGEVGENGLEQMLALSDPDSYLTKTRSMSENERETSRQKLLRKRYWDPVPECGNPIRRSRCTKIMPTIVINSVNIGRTGRICFPSTHRCMKPLTCPCSVRYNKCPARTTCCLLPETLCFEQTETSTASTIGRCHGIDTETPTPIEEGLCLATPSLVGSKRRIKRCACDCGCGCPHNLRLNHPGRALARGSCGCGCGCGCLHSGRGHCGTMKPLT